MTKCITVVLINLRMHQYFIKTPSLKLRIEIEDF